MAFRSVQAGDIIDGRYRLGQELGRGPYTRVFKAEEVKLDRVVVVKILISSGEYANAESRFEREAFLLSKLAHENTLTLFESGWDKGLEHPFLVTEYVPGLTLWEVIRRQGAIDAARTVGIVRQILLSMREAHDKGIVHRDLKPNNVMLYDTASERDKVKVLDFGIAKLVHAVQMEDEVGDVTLEGRMVGTPRYMAPELIAGQDPSPATDIYAVGLVMVEMITGRRAVQGKLPTQIIARQLSREPIVAANEPDVPALLLDVLRRATAKNPKSRFDTVQRFIDALDALDKDALAAASLASTPSPKKAEEGDVLPPGISQALVILSSAFSINSGEPTASSEAWPSHDEGSALQPVEVSPQGEPDIQIFTSLSSPARAAPQASAPAPLQTEPPLEQLEDLDPPQPGEASVDVDEDDLIGFFDDQRWAAATPFVDPAGQWEVLGAEAEGSSNQGQAAFDPSSSPDQAEAPGALAEGVSEPTVALAEGASEPADALDEGASEPADVTAATEEPEAPLTREEAPEPSSGPEEAESARGGEVEALPVDAPFGGGEAPATLSAPTASEHRRRGTDAADAQPAPWPAAQPAARPVAQLPARPAPRQPLASESAPVVEASIEEPVILMPRHLPGYPERFETYGARRVNPWVIATIILVLLAVAVAATAWWLSQKPAQEGGSPEARNVVELPQAVELGRPCSSARG